jgi:tRNA(Ile)-lysidine synthase
VTVGDGRLEGRVARRWREASWTTPGDRVVVAVSGGVDSLVLLHLLRFPLASLGARPVAAHFDHRMRAESGSDARWVRGLCGAWEVPFRSSEAERPPASEAEARRLRYRFLWRIVEEEGAARLLTGHHADDQAETILFRILRGTGIHGLGGMEELREPGLLRPLLSEPRAEVEAYAARIRLRPRIDPTNLGGDWARNRIRLEILPRLESVHPGARAALLRLGRNARRTGEALDALLEPLLRDLVRERAQGRITVDRERFLSHPPPVRNALLRALTAEAGLRLGETGTVAALEFMTRGPSGGRLHLPGSARLARDFGLLHLEWGRDRDPGAEAGTHGGADAPLVLSGPAPGGSAAVRLAGRRFRVEWGAERGTGAEGWTEAFDPDALAFPLTVRLRRDGDRTRGRAGSRKLKKLLGELGVPREQRDRIPVVVDGRGEVIWIPGRHRASAAPPRAGGRPWYLGIWHDDTDD